MIGLITGANKGLGLQLVIRGLELGHLVIAGVYKDNGLADLRELKHKYGDQLNIQEMDVTKEKDIIKAANFIDEQYGRLDYIVNNAGILLESKYDTSDPISEIDIKKLSLNLEVNTIGPARVLKYMIPLLYKAQKAVIVNISSEAGHLTPDGYAYMMYSISKHALNMYTQKIRNYIKEKKQVLDIKVCMIHPGRMNTDMGVENAQIEPFESAKGIYDVILGKVACDYDIPFIDYQGRQMPY